MPRNLPHIFVPESGESEPYTSPRTPIPPRPPERNRAEQAAHLGESLSAAIDNGLEILHAAPPDVAPGSRGVYLEFSIPPGQEQAFDKLENRPKQIELVAIRSSPEGGSQATVFVPESQIDFYLSRVREYEQENTRFGKPKHAALIDRIDDVRLGSLSSIYTDDPESFPPNDQPIWWEVWLRNGTQSAFDRASAALQVRVKDHSITFPEREVKIALATPRQMERVMQRSGALAELRIARDTPSFYLSMQSDEEALWVDDLRERLDVPPSDEVAVCLLDSGIIREHPLLEQLVAADDMHTCDPAWGTTENPDSDGHGTGMAGLSLFGDLTDLLAAPARFQASHRLESVKVLPPNGQNEPDAYGAITLEGIARAEVQAPHRSRAICMAITSSHETAGGRPSSWSAALDQACYNAGNAQRLFLVSAGNIRDELTVDQYPGENDLSGIESPAQAWNAVTVGAFTDKTHIADPGYGGWMAVAPAGDLSPRSRTSLTWDKGWPIKPEVVFEGGNLAHDGAGDPALPLDDLCVLSTHHKVQLGLLQSFADTSAATALAAHMAGQILASKPSLWAETARALIVHSAEWTDAMLRCLEPVANQQTKRVLLRRYGYGVPSIERALRSANNDLTLVIEDELQPFVRAESQIRTREMHIHRLPWPQAELLALGDAQVELRVTLSYYVEPNPGERGWTKRHKYSSHGLRFEVKGALESDDLFRRRINRAARVENEDTGAPLASDRWYLGPQLRNVGSIHSDVWQGTAADLAQRGAIGVYPVGGWWREKSRLFRWDNPARYCLLVTLRVPDANVDIYTSVAAQVAAEAEVASEIEIDE